VAEAEVTTEKEKEGAAAADVVMDTTEPTDKKEMKTSRQPAAEPARRERQGQGEVEATKDEEEPMEVDESKETPKETTID